MRSFDRWFSDQRPVAEAPKARHGYNEGSVCGRGDCDGRIDWTLEKNCSCHISPPCNNCVENRLHCPDCGWHEDDEEMKGE